VLMARTLAGSCTACRDKVLQLPWKFSPYSAAKVCAARGIAVAP
jgi:hypothetical protein